MARIDLVVFGATGFTGKYVAREVYNVVSQNSNLTWAIAGRSESKLKDVISDIEKRKSVDLKNVPIIIADIKDELSLNNMAARSKVILNCCGPYRFFGEPVVKACVSNGSHHVDVSGEPQYMENMQLKYDEEAKKAGVYIVSACGFDSIPTDLGVIFLEKNFEGQVNSVETYLESRLLGELKEKSAALHYATWESAVYGVAHAGELGPLRRQIYPTRLPPLLPKLLARSTIHKSTLVNKWSLPFPGSDKAVVQRSQRFLLESEKKRPVQIMTYCSFSNLANTLLVAAVGVFFFMMASFGFGRKLLLQYPSFFSFGAASHDGPTEESAEKTYFSVTLAGRGWSEKLADPLDNHTDAPNKELVVKVSGMNPGYGATATLLVQSALTILKESDKMPGTGGVLPPGAAFVSTSITDQLTAAGVTFEILPTILPNEKPSHSYLNDFILGMISNGIY